MNRLKSTIFLVFILISFSALCQNKLTETLTLNEFLGYVKKFHPIAKQANLQVTAAQANIMAARGGFDPKLEADYNTKEFKNKEYYTYLNSTFKIPTWYGVEIKAAFDRNDGAFLNPEDNLPTQGLTTVGISLPIGQGLLINSRMAALKQAKIFNQLTQAERDLEIVNLLSNATNSYLNWFKNYKEYKLYQTFLNNAQIRFNGIKALISAGDRPSIDSTEARIIVKNRMLNVEQSRIKLVKTSLELATFLWLDNTIPLELQATTTPEEFLEKTIEETLKNNIIFPDNLTNHPKIVALENKVSIMQIDQKLKGDLLKPRIDLNYNFISQYPNNTQDFNPNNYKFGLTFSYPLFLRKERGNYKMAKIKTQNAQLDLNFENLNLKNKINAQTQEVASFKTQIKTVNELVSDFKTMLAAEERLFFFGESSIFLLNNRENSLLSASIQEIDIQIKYCNAQSELFRTKATSLE